MSSLTKNVPTLLVKCIFWSKNTRTATSGRGWVMLFHLTRQVPSSSATEMASFEAGGREKRGGDMEGGGGEEAGENSRGGSDERGGKRENL